MLILREDKDEMNNQSKFLGKSLVVGVILLLLCMCITPSVAIDNEKKNYNPIRSGNTLYVGGSGPDNYSTIKAAVNDAAPLDTVFVYNDSSPYYERISIIKQIYLIGEEKNSTIIDGGNQYSVIELHGGHQTVSGFTIRGGKGNDWREGGIRLFSGYNTISNNIICNNKNGIAAIIVKKSFGTNLIINNIITGNSDRGVAIQDNDNYNITNNEIIYNGGSQISFYRSNNNIISKNKVISRKNWSCIRVTQGENSTIMNNFVHSENPTGKWQEGIHLSGSPNSKIIGNKVSNCNSHGIYVSMSDYSVVKNNSLVNDGFFLPSSYNIDFVDNTVNDRPVVYLESTSDKEISEEAGQIILNSCSDITVKDQYINNTDYGIILWKSNKCSINNNILNSNEIGIYLYKSRNNRIKYNLFDSNYKYGAFLENVAYCLVKKNNFTNNNVGLMIDCDEDFTLINSVISNNFLDNEKQADFVVSHRWFLFPIIYMFNFWNDIFWLHLVYFIEGNFFWYDEYYSGQRVLVYYTLVDLFPRRQPYAIEV